ncbi:tRNA(m(1)G37)methyltransferase [Gonapodya sp. JEL0774]|nr:tRNA(m(1)G37)methyltransferase [Gonapodya sp. JEL0774]
MSGTVSMRSLVPSSPTSVPPISTTLATSAKVSATPSYLARFRPPPNPGLTQITPESKKLFSASFSVPALRVPASATNLVLKSASDFLLNLPRYRSAFEDPTPEDPTTISDSNSTSKAKPIQYRIVPLRPDLPDDPSHLPNPLLSLMSAHNATLTTHSIVLDYSYWTTEDILRSVIPATVNVPGAFETVGHIAHMNLREDVREYRAVVGAVVLEKNKHIRTVVNKLDSIDTEFRFFKMEVLAGDDDMVAEVHESNSRFHLDFSRVYWNSRLHSEHERLVRQFHQGSVVCDVFAGVGPFAVPAAVNGGWGPASSEGAERGGGTAGDPPPPRLILANDLNPASYEYLVKNISLNHVMGQVVPYNLDGREFIRRSITELQSDCVQKGIVEAVKRGRRKAAERVMQAQAKKRKRGVEDVGGAGRTRHSVGNGSADKSGVPDTAQEEPVDSSSYRWPHHFVMNLPATAVEFLDAFSGLYRPHLHLLPPHLLARLEDPNKYDPPTASSDVKLDLPFPMPTVHVHCFSKKEDVERDAVEMVESRLGCVLQPGTYSAHRVRDVAPRKEMVCVSFVLPVEVAFRPEINTRAKLVEI